MGPHSEGGWWERGTGAPQILRLSSCGSLQHGCWEGGRTTLVPMHLVPVEMSPRR